MNEAQVPMIYGHCRVHVDSDAKVVVATSTYAEENRNTIFKVNKKDVEITDKYFWVNYSTLNMLIQVNNCINIQLRNLLSLLKL